MSELLAGINKVRQARREMEREIMGAVESAVRKFKDVTGLTPECIYVDMEDMTNIHSVMREHVPCAVRATVNLEL